jgi:hypothetical protein
LEQHALLRDRVQRDRAAARGGLFSPLKYPRRLEPGHDQAVGRQSARPGSVCLVNARHRIETCRSGSA